MCLLLIRLYFPPTELSYFLNIPLHFFVTPTLIFSHLECWLRPQSSFSRAPFLLCWCFKSQSASSPIFPLHILNPLWGYSIYSTYYLFSSPWRHAVLPGVQYVPLLLWLCSIDVNVIQAYCIHSQQEQKKDFCVSWSRSLIWKTKQMQHQVQALTVTYILNIWDTRGYQPFWALTP